jgi:hypothetical protein
MLSPADLKFYQEQGYLVVPDVLDAASSPRSAPSWRASSTARVR